MFHKNARSLREEAICVNKKEFFSNTFALLADCERPWGSLKENRETPHRTRTHANTQALRDTI